MSWTRTTSLAAVAALAVFGLTACGSGGGEPEGSGKPAATSPAAPADAASGDTGDSSDDATVAGVKAPDDLPAGLPLPKGELTSVTGSKNAYVLTYRTDDPEATLDAYRSSLEGAQYTVVDIGGTFTASSGTTAVQITTTTDTVILTLAGA
ncbi:hypothetical protein ACF07T_34805 [Streptomyces sp. NPDC015184]|uniref:hypothetical protein n=1 Tax=Streptomyces sp. NPDC015184 TaxID=3364946 RepID=UPI0036FE25F2